MAHYGGFFAPTSITLLLLQQIPAFSILFDGSGTWIWHIMISISSVLISSPIKAMTISIINITILIHYDISHCHCSQLFGRNSHHVFICTSVKFRLRERSSRFETERYLSVWNIEVDEKYLQETKIYINQKWELYEKYYDDYLKVLFL